MQTDAKTKRKPLWQLQQAKNRLSELVRASHEGPQIITLHGKPAAVVLSVDEYQRITGRGETLTDFLAHSPLSDSGIRVERDLDTGRDIAL